MSLEQYGARLGVTPQAVHRLESSEAKGTLSLARLRRSADALMCDVIVVVVPRMPLEGLIQAQAMVAAQKHVRRVGHTMALESQGVNDESMHELHRLAAEAMIKANDRRIWSP